MSCRVTQHGFSGVALAWMRTLPIAIKRTKGEAMFHTPAHKQVNPAAAPAQVVEQTLWMNVYRAGYFHRANKPGCLDMHAGDFYTSEASARAQASPMSHYIGTVSFQWVGPLQHENPPDARPVPLHVTRAFHPSAAA